MKLKFSFSKKPTISKKKISEVLINHIGEIVILSFILALGLGSYIFWKYAWEISNFSPQARLDTQYIPKKILEESLQSAQGRNKAFVAPLAPLNIRDPFTPFNQINTSTPNLF